MIELKEEDGNLCRQLVKILMNYCGETGENEGAVETLERILSDHKLAVEIRAATKMAHSLGMDGIEDDIKNRQIVKRLEEYVEQQKYNLDEGRYVGNDKDWYNIFIGKLQKILEVE